MRYPGGITITGTDVNAVTRFNGAANPANGGMGKVDAEGKCHEILDGKSKFPGFSLEDRLCHCANPYVFILSGQLMAVFQSNAGGAWDNAKKYIEDGNFGGKHSEPHKAGVVGDTVGDPLKDTAGPALNPMIKVINLVSLIIAPVIVAMRLPGEPMGAGTIIAMVFCLAALGWAIWQSKRETEPLATPDTQA